MFKFFRRKKDEIVVETQRQTVERCIKELNEILDGVDGAKLYVDLKKGKLAVDLPQQMPDEAKALPAPEKVEAASAAKSSEKTQPVKDAAPVAKPAPAAAAKAAPRPTEKPQAKPEQAAKPAEPAKPAAKEKAPA